MSTAKERAEFGKISGSTTPVAVLEFPKVPARFKRTDKDREAWDQFESDVDDWRKKLQLKLLSTSPTTSSVASAAKVEQVTNIIEGKPGLAGVNGKDATLIPPDKLGLVKNVWIAFRTDGLPGDGSQSNPFDGSTVDKFDTIMQGLGTYTAIHIGPGDFETRGARDGSAIGGWYAKEGWRIQGSGMDITTLKLIDCPNEAGFYWVIGNTRSGFQSSADFVEVSDLTCDCNMRGQTANCANGAIAMYGDRLCCRRVHCVDWGSKYPGRECFVITLTAQLPQGGGTPSYLACLTEDCICDQPYEGVNAFSENSSVLFNGSAGKTGLDLNNYDYNATIKDCIVDGTKTNGQSMRKMTAMSVQGKGAPLIEGNLIINAGVSVWQDSWVGRNVIVKNNRFFSVEQGVVMNMGTSVYLFYGGDTYARTYRTISSVSSTTTTATVVSTGHGFATNDWVDIKGTGLAQYDGVWKITVVNANSFTFAIASFSGSSASGSAVKVDARTMVGITPASVAVNNTFGVVDTGVRHGVLVGDHVQVAGVTGTEAAAYNVDYGVVVAVTDTTFTYQLNAVAVAAAPAGTKIWWDRAGMAPDPGNVLSSSGTTATMHTITPHNYEVGDLIAVSAVEGGGSNSNYNGYFLITAVTSTTFSYKMAGTASESTTRARYRNIWTLRHLLVESNYMELTGPPLNNGDGTVYGSGISLTCVLYKDLPALAFAIYQNICIRNNVIRLTDGVAAGASINFGIALARVANGIVENNIIEAGRIDSPGTTGKLVTWQPTVPQGKLRFANNRSYDGTLILAQDIVNPGNYRYYEDPEQTLKSSLLMNMIGI